MLDLPSTTSENRPVCEGKCHHAVTGSLVGHMRRMSEEIPLAQQSQPWSWHGQPDGFLCDYGRLHGPLEAARPNFWRRSTLTFRVAPRDDTWLARLTRDDGGQEITKACKMSNPLRDRRWLLIWAVLRGSLSVLLLIVALASWRSAISAQSQLGYSSQFTTAAVMTTTVDTQTDVNGGVTDYYNVKVHVVNRRRGWNF